MIHFALIIPLNNSISNTHSFNDKSCAYITVKYKFYKNNLAYVYLINADIRSNMVPRTYPAVWNAFGRAKAPVPTIRLKT